MNAPGFTFAYAANPYNSTLFTSCCRAAVLRTSSGRLEDCPLCGRSVVTVAPTDRRHREGR